MARAQQAPDMFKDVDQSHWAYQAVESLRSKGILIGYPDGTFKGKRTLTRYEFAVALDRALKTVVGIKGDQGDQGPAGPQGEVGPAGPQGDQGPAGITPEELQTFKQLADEFKNELASLGDNVSAIDKRLDALTKDVSDIKDQLNKMPKIYGGVFWGYRNDSGNLNGADRDGRKFAKTDNMINDMILGIKANLSNGAVVNAELTSNNYKNYLGGSLSDVEPFGNTQQDTYIHLLNLSTPLPMIGRDTNLTVGRFGMNISHLTLWKPDVDTYLNDPFQMDGQYYVDGARLKTNFGSLNMEMFGAQPKNVSGSNSAMGWNIPWAGGTIASATGMFGSSKPFGTMQGAMPVNEMVGVNLGLNIRQLKGGYLRGTILDLNDQGGQNTLGFSNVYVYGAGLDMNLTDRITLSGEWAKTAVGNGKFNQSVNSAILPNQPAGMNNAMDAKVGYKSGPMAISAGYRYIDPLFYAPGYWGKIGNWYNPTNIQGPTFNASYDLSPSVGVSLGGDYYTAARNMGSIGNLTTNDNIYRALAGVRWDVSKNFQTTLDYEGVYWDFGKNGVMPGLPSDVHPTEQYIRIGTGYNLNNTTQLKLGYELGMFDGHGLLHDGDSTGTKNSYNTFTSSVAVKF
jgi:hypothetical protein